MSNYYDILGVSKNATNKEISEAYRKLAMQYHPDRNPGDEDSIKKFKEAAEAFEVLNDTEKKQNYDTYGSAKRPQSRGNPFDVFNDIFQDRGFRQTQIKGQNIYKKIHITLKEAYNGCMKTVLYRNTVVCSVCNGNGGETSVCDLCKGHGTVMKKHGTFRMNFRCSKCSGSGKTISKKCNPCNGNGFTRNSESKSADFTIAPGVLHGTKGIIHGKGEFHYQGMKTDYPGDLIMQVYIQKHKFYQRDNHGNLICTIPISYTDSLLGKVVTLPLLSGDKVDLKIPPQISSGKQLRIPNEGMPHGNGKMYGNIYVTIQVEPILIQDEEFKVLIDKLHDFEKNNPSDKIVLFNKVLKEI